MEEAAKLALVDGVYASAKALLHSSPGDKNYAIALRKLKSMVNTLADAEGAQ